MQIVWLGPLELDYVPLDLYLIGCGNVNYRTTKYSHSVDI